MQCIIQTLRYTVHVKSIQGVFVEVYLLLLLLTCGLTHREYGGGWV